MSPAIRAIYENGVLRPLDPLPPLTEGQELVLNIQDIWEQDISPEELDRRLRAAGLLVELDDEDIFPGVQPLTEEELDAMSERFLGGKTFLDLVNEERGER
jgi:predicted DNA-binding antitoxin AbrB/MazE fold protein